ncbi:MAG TPA: hypothetical protein VF774_24435 [Pseudoduganella sp.]|jgi:hypothetical protein
MNVTLLAQLGGVLRLGVILAIALHVLALVPQCRSGWFQPRFLNVSLYGLVLAVAQGALLVLADGELGPEDPHGRGSLVAWCLGGALSVNIAVAAQNLLAVMALMRLHRPSAVIAHGLRAVVMPMVWVGATLSVAAYGAVQGWF